MNFNWNSISSTSHNFFSSIWCPQRVRYVIATKFVPAKGLTRGSYFFVSHGMSISSCTVDSLLAHTWRFRPCSRNFRQSWESLSFLIRYKTVCLTSLSFAIWSSLTSMSSEIMMKMQIIADQMSKFRFILHFVLFITSWLV